jgi:hypothetical protein
MHLTNDGWRRKREARSRCEELQHIERLSNGARVTKEVGKALSPPQPILTVLLMLESETLRHKLIHRAKRF